MKKYLLIELCNFVDYPMGGHLSFAKHMIKAFGNELAIVGITTDDNTPIGCWTKKVIDGVEYDFFSVKRVKPSIKKDIIPERIKGFVWTWQKRNKIVSYGCTNLIIQTPEVFFNFANFANLNICLVLPGLENPLNISRYSYGKYFSKVYEILFYKRINKAKILLAAADVETMENFIVKGKGRFSREKLFQFPTRFDSSVFYQMDKNHVKDSMGFPLSQVIVVTSGRLNSFKGWKFLIDSFEYFGSKVNARFIILGEGEDRLEIESHIEKKGLGKSIVLKGKVDHVTLASYLNAADLFVMGSYFEGWSTSLVEAVACATPICTTNFSSAKELVKDNINGFVVNERDERRFAFFMEKALNLHKDNLSKMANEIKILSVSNLKSEILNLWKVTD